MSMKPAAVSGKQGVQGPKPASGPHPQGDPKHQHKVLGPTHPGLFGGGKPAEGSAAEEAGESPAFEKAEDKMLPNKGMPAKK